MVSRAGIMPSPQAATPAVNFESGARGTESMATAMQALARTATGLNDMLEPLARQGAEALANKDFEQGNYTQRLAFTAADLAYNNAIEAAYLAKAQNDIDLRAGDIERESHDDVESYQRAFAAAKEGYLKSTPGDYARAVGQYFDNVGGRGAQRVAGRRQERALKEGEAALKSRLEVLDARNSELVPSDPDWAEYMLDREDVLQALSNPLYGITEEEQDADRAVVFSRATATAIGRTALQMYEESPSAASAAKAIAFLDEQFRRTDLTLTSAQRDQYFGQQRRAIKAADDQRKAIEAALKREIREVRREIASEVRDELESVDTLLDANQLPDESRIRALVRGAEESGSGPLINRARDLEATYDAASALRGQNAVDASATLSGWLAQAEAGDVTAARRYNAGLDYVRKTETQQRTKPLEFLRDHMGERIARIDSPAGWQERADQARRAAQMAGGVTPQYLLPSEKNRLAALSDVGGEEAFAAAYQIASSLPREDARRVFQEVGPQGPALGYAGMILVDSGDREAARRILLGQQMLRRGTTGGYRPTPLPADRRDSAFASIAPATLNGAARADRRRAADLLFEGQYSETGDDSPEAYERAVRTAMGAVTFRGVTYGGPATVRGLSTTAPSWIRADQFQAVMNGMQPMDYVAASSTGSRPFVRDPGGRTGVAPLATLKQTRLVPAGKPGLYYLSLARAPGEDGVWPVLPDENDRPYVIDLNKLRGSLAQRRPDAVMPEPQDGR